MPILAVMKRSIANGSSRNGTPGIRPAADSRRGSSKVEQAAKRGASRAREAIIAFKNS
jgi:hypothetical protein